ncbi:glycosyl hydrolase family 28-related protein [Streptacidiphilus sp. N1-12]|uniref:Glycosyl hydrolase family 28-related protein n=2 Tax=Streptacidiphilus alkalitolerans TaxID=3342712 RepID=A0ABV6WF65_9ACTN
MATGIASAGSAEAVTASGVDWLNVRDYGAVGDGKHDDTAQIQSALNAVTAGGVVYFPNGVYEISAPLVVTVAGTKLVGDKASTGYSAGGSNQTTIDALPGFTGAAMLQVSGVPDFAMRDLTVHGTNTTGTTVGVSLTGAGSCMIENVLVGRTAGDGFFVQGNNPVVMRQVGVWHAGASSGAGYGFNLQAITDSWYTDCLSSGCQTAGWNIQGGDNSTWIGCRAEDGPGYGFHFHDRANLFGGLTFVGCSTDLNGKDGFRLENLSGNGAVQLNACEFRRDGNNAGAGTTMCAGIAVVGCAIPVLLDGTTVTARQGDHGGADAPHYGLNVSRSVYVSVNGGYLSCDATGAPVQWDGQGALPIGPAVLTATVSASVPTYNTSRPWNTTPNSHFDQSATQDTSVLTQTLSGATSGSNPLIHQYHPAATTKGLGLQISGEPLMRWVVQADGTQVWGGGSTTRDTSWGRLGPAAIGSIDSDIVAALPGRGLRIAEGTNAKMGTADLRGTTGVVVNTTALTGGSRIFLTVQKPAGTAGGVAYVSAADPVAGTFTIKGVAGDTSTVAWMLVESA